MWLKKKLSIKQLLLSNKNWWHFYEKNKQRLRKSITVSITKLLSCKHKVRGYYQYECFNPNCLHQKHVIFTCKSKACSSCGKKLTAQWLKKQYQILPNIPYQHITLTMPSELWDFFWCNRSLLNEIAKKAAKCIQKIAAKKNVTPGRFIAIHTFGRNMKRNVHIHLSTTTAGITKDGTHKRVACLSIDFALPWPKSLRLNRQVFMPRPSPSRALRDLASSAHYERALG